MVPWTTACDRGAVSGRVTRDRREQADVAIFSRPAKTLPKIGPFEPSLVDLTGPVSPRIGRLGRSARRWSVGAEHSPDTARGTEGAKPVPGLADAKAPVVLGADSGFGVKALDCVGHLS